MKSDLMNNEQFEVTHGLIEPLLIFHPQMVYRNHGNGPHKKVISYTGLLKHIREAATPAYDFVAMAIPAEKHASLIAV